jgi:alpha-ribazole phosphatase
MKEMNTQERLRLYLIRHGEVNGSASGRLFGRTDVPLSERGKEQSRQLAEVLSTAQLSAVYSSDLQRARVTAEIIAKRKNLTVQENSAWREIDMGEWEGRTVAALHQEAPELVAQVFKDPASFEYPGGESFAAFVARVQTALDELLLTQQRGDLALVAHGGVCRAIIGSVLGVPMHNWLRLAQAYACLNVIEWYAGSPLLVSLNSSETQSHLATPCDSRLA